MNSQQIASPGDGAPHEAVSCRGLEKDFVGGDGQALHILRGVELTVNRGESVAIIGKSGAGKSTLLHLLGALDHPSDGEVRIGGRSVADMAPDRLAQMRNRSVGFVFQFHHLLREFTALENVMIPAMVGGAEQEEAREGALRILSAVDLDDRLDHRPWQLSGGEQQRVAVARALANQPVLLLADEPSGNLDEQTSEQLHDLLFDLRRNQGLAMVLVTHNRDLAARADRVLRLEEGRLRAVEDE